jgi:hypothetical protein
MATITQIHHTRPIIHRRPTAKTDFERQFELLQARLNAMTQEYHYLVHELEKLADPIVDEILERVS